MRIVSLTWEATEILEALGLGDQIVAPRALSPTAARAGEPLTGGAPGDADAAATIRAPAARVPPAGNWGVANVSPDALAEASPTLIFTSETSAGSGVPRTMVRRAVATLRPRPAVYALEPHSVGEILADVKTVGDATGRQAQARALIEGLRARIDAVSLRSARAHADGRTPRVVCLHRVDPPVAAGWWLAELIGLAGGIDVLDGAGRPPRAVTWDTIQSAQPDLVVSVAAGSDPRVLTLGPVVPPVSLRGRGVPGVRVHSESGGEGHQRGEGSARPPAEAIDAHPGPASVSLLEKLAALILPPTPSHR